MTDNPSAVPLSGEGPNGVYIVAPAGRDSHVIKTELARAAMHAIATTVSGLADALDKQFVDAIIIVEEALLHLDLPRVASALKAQPPWSDCPVIILTLRGAARPDASRAIAVFANVTLLERPLHPDALITAARAAIRARARQFAARDYIAEREVAEQQVRTLAESLELRVASRTADLTEALEQQSRIEAQLRESEQLYRHTIELSTLATWTADGEGQLTSLGSDWVHSLGLSPSDLRERQWDTFLHPDDCAAATKAWAIAQSSGNAYDSEFRLRQADGSYRWCRARAAARRHPSGSIERWYGTIEDVTERHVSAEQLRQLQTKLIHLSRGSAMGAMGTAIAHELNQPLTAIANYVRGSRVMLSEMHLPQADHLLAALASADQAVVRAGEIVRRVRDHVSSRDVQRTPEKLADIIDEACALAMVDAHAAGVALYVKLDPEAMLVLVDRIQIQQVLINLLRNSVEAMQQSTVRKIFLRASRVSPNLCEIVVTDTGPGIAEETAAHLFEHFNTTKTDGMGIGLSICQTIVEAHGGKIWSVRIAGEGAEFHFTVHLASTPEVAGQPVAGGSV